MEHYIDEAEFGCTKDEIAGLKNLFAVIQNNDALFTPEELDNDGIEESDEIRDLDFYTQDHEIDINMTHLQEEISVLKT